MADFNGCLQTALSFAAVVVAISIAWAESLRSQRAKSERLRTLVEPAVKLCDQLDERAHRVWTRGAGWHYSAKPSAPNFNELGPWWRLCRETRPAFEALRTAAGEHAELVLALTRIVEAFAVYDPDKPDEQTRMMRMFDVMRVIKRERQVINMLRFD